MDCILSGHGRVMEYVNVEMVLKGYSARVEREWYTHIEAHRQDYSQVRDISITRERDLTILSRLPCSGMKRHWKNIRH